MVTQEDTIFVSGMDPEATELDIETHFGAIGIIKVSILTFINTTLDSHTHTYKYI